MSEPTNTDRVDEVVPDLDDVDAPPGVYERSDRTAQKRDRLVRWSTLLVILAAITAIGVTHQTGTPFKAVGVDALCPFGGIETLWSVISGAGLLQRIAVSSVILLMATIAIAVVFRRAFCGYLCPLGAVQELFARMGSLVWKRRRPEVPRALDRPARFLKYVVFAVFAVWTWQAGELVIRAYDPWVAWQHLTSAELLTEFGVGAAILAISLVGSFVYDRFFCKYLCPMGAFLAVISRFSVFKVHREAANCIDCKACDRACPVNIEVSRETTVTNAECISCNECVNACPVADTLSVSTTPSASGRSTLRPSQAFAGVAGIFVALVALSSAAGAFAWTMPTLAPAQADESGTVQPTIDVEEIKGSMTVDEVIAATGIPAAAFEARFGIKADETGQRIKDLAGTYGYDVHTDFREFVAAEMERIKAEGGVAAPGESPAAED